jgi:hypothetical protein
VLRPDRSDHPEARLRDRAQSGELPGSSGS